MSCIDIVLVITIVVLFILLGLTYYWPRRSAAQPAQPANVAPPVYILTGEQAIQLANDYRARYAEILPKPKPENLAQQPHRDVFQRTADYIWSRVATIEEALAAKKAVEAENKVFKERIKTLEALNATLQAYRDTAERERAERERASRPT